MTLFRVKFLPLLFPFPCSVRESSFLMQDSHQLGEWLERIGLEMYRQLMETRVPSGDRLVTMARQQSNIDLAVSETAEPAPGSLSLPLSLSLSLSPSLCSKLG